MSPAELNEYLCCLRANNVMSAHLKFDGTELAVTIGPDAPLWGGEQTSAEPGGWKSTPSDPQDPDPLGLGTLDAPMAMDDDEVAL